MAMQPKHARQVLLKILDMCADPTAADSKLLKGTNQEFYRTDVGEYRVVFRLENDELLIPLIGKRNDEEVYKEMRRRGL